MTVVFIAVTELFLAPLFSKTKVAVKNKFR